MVLCQPSKASSRYKYKYFDPVVPYRVVFMCVACEPQREARHRTEILSLRGPTGRGNLPVQFNGYIDAEVEATSRWEIPTDGKAVLGMTYFYRVASIFPFVAPTNIKREGL